MIKTVHPETGFSTDDETKIYHEKIKKILGINGEIIIEEFENSVTAIYVKNNGKKYNLADYGFGYSQLVPILIEFNKGINNALDYIIIEEPEANLHPSLQSKLADIFVETIKVFPNLKMIIETHSEYLIRKLQYLTAANQLETKDCIIHYFNADENVSLTEAKVKPIEITKEGNLTDNFGPGFYDEATKLQFDLMRIRKEQKN